MASLESLDQVGLEGFLLQDCLFQDWSQGIWTTTVNLWSTAPRTSLGSLDQVGLLVRFTFHRVGNRTLKVLDFSGKIFDDLSVLIVPIVHTTTSEIIDDEELEYWTLFETIVESEFNKHEHIIKGSNLNDESGNL